MSLLCLYQYVVFACVLCTCGWRSEVNIWCVPRLLPTFFWGGGASCFVCPFVCFVLSFLFPLLELKTKLRALHLLANTITLNSILSPSTLVLRHGLQLNLQFTDLARLAVSEFRDLFASVCWTGSTDSLSYLVDSCDKIRTKAIEGERISFAHKFKVTVCHCGKVRLGFQTAGYIITRVKQSNARVSFSPITVHYP